MFLRLKQASTISSGAPDNQHLAVRSSDTINIYGVDNSILSVVLPSFPFDLDLPQIRSRFGFANQILWSPDSQTILFVSNYRYQMRDNRIIPAGSTLTLYDASDGSVLFEKTYEARATVVHYDGRWYAVLEDVYKPALDAFTSQEVENVMRVVDIMTDEVLLQIEAAFIDFQVSDNRLLLATYRADAANPQDGVATVRDLETGEQVTQIQGLISIAGSRFDTFGRFLRTPGVVTDQFGTRGEITLQQIDGSISYSIAMDGIGVRIWGDTDYLMIYQIPSWFSYIDQLVDMRTGEVVLDSVSEKIGASLDDPYSWSPNGKRMVTGYRDIEIWTLQCEE